MTKWETVGTRAGTTLLTWADQLVLSIYYLKGFFVHLSLASLTDRASEKDVYQSLANGLRKAQFLLYHFAHTD